MTNPLTREDRDRLAALHAEATPGPWRLGADLKRVNTDYRDERGNLSDENLSRNGWAKTICSLSHASWADVKEHVANAALIVAAVNALPSLLRALDDADRLTEENARLTRERDGWLALYKQWQEAADRRLEMVSTTKRETSSEKARAEAEVARLREALQRIASDPDVSDLAGNPALWSSTIAVAALEGSPDVG